MDVEGTGVVVLVAVTLLELLAVMKVTLVVDTAVVVLETLDVVFCVDTEGYARNSATITTMTTTTDDNMAPVFDLSSVDIR